MTGKRILVIEDEFLIALEITAALEQGGFSSVEQAASEKEALKRITEERWDGVIADANLNGRSIDRIASLLGQRSIPFIVVTGYGKDTLPAAIGAAPVLEKPFHGAQLAKTLIDLLQGGTS